MAKKPLEIPFKNGRPCWYRYDPADEMKDNFEFKETFHVVYFSRGCSSAKMILRTAKNAKKYGTDGYCYECVDYEVFLSNSVDIIRKMVDGKISGVWTFVKKGSNYGIKLVKHD